jgi:hypothetical protein
LVLSIVLPKQLGARSGSYYPTASILYDIDLNMLNDFPCSLINLAWLFLFTKNLHYLKINAALSQKANS